MVRKSCFVSLEKREIHSFFWPACFCIAFISSFFLNGHYVPSLRLDDSFSPVLEYAFEHHFHFGRDIVFTYGPLGFLSTTASQGHLVGLRILFALFWCGIVAWSATGFARQIPTPSRYVFLVWFFVFSSIPDPAYGGSVPHWFEQRVLLVMAYGCTVLMGDMHRRRMTAVIYLLVFSLLSLIKFTFLIATAASIVLCIAVHLFRRDIKTSVFIGTAFLGLFIVLWVGTGQQLSSLIPWIKGCIEITVGYTEAMTVAPKLNVLGVSVAAVVLCISAIWLIARSARLTSSTVGILSITTLYLFLSWKHGFVRADFHVFVFLLTIPLLYGVLLTGPILETIPAGSQGHLRVLFLCVTLSCFLGALFQDPAVMAGKLLDWPRHMRGNAHLLLKLAKGDWHSSFAALEPDRKQTRATDLPAARDLIGKDPVDVVNYLQWAAISNGLTYRPRPVIQSYSAYNPYLLGLNLSYYRSEQRPPYLLLRMETIDGRFPTLDDATALPYILKNYQPVARDGIFLVLRNARRRSGDIRRRLIHEQKIAFGDPLDLKPWTEGPVLMRVSIRPTFFGRVVKFLFQAPELFLYIQTGGKESRYRFIPAMAERGFLISPILETNDDVFNLLTHAKGNLPDGIRFMRPAYAWGQLADAISVELYRLEDFPSRDAETGSIMNLDSLRNSVFNPSPVRGESVPSREWIYFAWNLP